MHITGPPGPAPLACAPPYRIHPTPAGVIGFSLRSQVASKITLPFSTFIAPVPCNSSTSRRSEDY